MSSQTLKAPTEKRVRKEGITAIRLLSISGASGAGKTTLVKRLVESSGGVFVPALSLTTRQPRDSDLAGEYSYISVAGFRSMIEKDCFAWHLEAHSHFYGTEKRVIEQARTINITNTTVFNITYQTVKVLREFLAKIGPHALAVHLPVYVLSPPPDELRRRITSRGGMEEDEIKQRIDDCLHWDDEAQRMAASGEIPFTFIRNDSSDGDISAPMLALSQALKG